MDLRLTKLPTIYGEKAVMRVLDRNAAVPSLDKLNLSAAVNANTGLSFVRLMSVNENGIRPRSPGCKLVPNVVSPIVPNAVQG
ncbi:MAG: hypothetical protein H7338_15250 [Candidatus Sericytochromatia bacterium]|nr:hypothetical protein [Candidatus Sericytochromatia bacterium]